MKIKKKGELVKDYLLKNILLESNELYSNFYIPAIVTDLSDHLLETIM